MAKTPPEPETPAAAPRARRKADDLRKDELVRVRVTAAQKEVLTRAAERAGADLSTWLRLTGLRVAHEEDKTGGGD